MRARQAVRLRRTLSCLTLVLTVLASACAPTTSVKRPPTPSPTPTPIPPSSQALILAAEQAGSISYGTALLYRAYALFGDLRLPRQFQGSGSVGEDPVLFAAAADPTTSLPPDIRAGLHPFVVRPAAPDSYFRSLTGPTAVAGPAVRLAAPAAPARPRDMACTAGWVTQDTANPAQAKVWAETGSDPTAAQQDVAAVAQLISGIWGPMAQLMGAPLPDDPDPATCNLDSRIDLYLVNPGQRAPRGAGGGEIGKSGEAWAQTIRDVALPGIHSPTLGTSAYIMIDRTLLHGNGGVGQSGRDVLRSTLVHEFFHVLEDAHYGKRNCTNTACYWFAEASAVWAESYFARDLAPTQVYSRFSGVFQGCAPRSNSTQPLNASADPAGADGDHAYAAFIWPYFLQQQPDGGPQRVAALWQGLEAADTWAAADNVVIDQQDLHTFALRNLNFALLPGNPIAPRYVGLDPHFPDNALPGEVDPPQGSAVAPIEGMRVGGILYPCLKHKATLTGDQQVTSAVAIQPVSARYYYYKVDDSAQQVTFNFAALDPANLEIDAVVHDRHQGWKVLNLTGARTKRFCRKTPGEDLTELYLVLTNKDLKQPINGNVLAQPSRQTCTCDTIQKVHQGWQGTITVSYDANLTASDQSVTVHRTASVTVRFAEWITSAGLVPTAGWGPGGATLIGTVIDGTAAVHDTITGGSLVTDIVGKGPPFLMDPSSSSTLTHGWLEWNTDTCSYFLGLAVDVTAVGTPNDGSGATTIPYYNAVAVDTGNTPSGDVTTLGGAGVKIPAHGPDNLQGQPGAFVDVAAADAVYGPNQGNALLSWHLTPIDPQPTP